MPQWIGRLPEDARGRTRENRLPGFRRLPESEDGSQLTELALVLPVLLLLLVGGVDFGRAFYVYIEVTSAAEAGALYGLQDPTDAAGMQAAALLYARDLPTLAAVAIWGGECSDGTGATVGPAAAPTCNNGTVEYIEVDTTATYTPILPYPGIPSVFTITGKSRMRAAF